MAERVLPLFPLNTVLFPGAMLPLHIFEERYKLMLQRCLQGDKEFGVVLIRSGQEVGGPAVPYEVGTVARIVHFERLAGGRFNLVTAGMARFRIVTLYHRQPYLEGLVQVLAPEPDAATAPEQLATVRELFDDYLDALGASETEFREPGIEAFTFRVAHALQIPLAEKQALLEAESSEARLRLEAQILRRERAVLRLLRAEPPEDTAGPFSPN